MEAPNIAVLLYTIVAVLLTGFGGLAKVDCILLILIIAGIYYLGFLMWLALLFGCLASLVLLLYTLYMLLFILMHSHTCFTI